MNRAKESGFPELDHAVRLARSVAELVAEVGAIIASGEDQAAVDSDAGQLSMDFSESDCRFHAGLTVKELGQDA